MKVRDVIRLIEAEGWTFHRQRGSHRQFKHPTKPGKVTVAGKPSDEMAPGTLGASSAKRAFAVKNGSRCKRINRWILDDDDSKRPIFCGKRPCINIAARSASG